MYHFLSGYTAKVAGTGKGLVGVERNSPPASGALSCPATPTVYGNLLRERSPCTMSIAAGQHRRTAGNTTASAGRMPIKVTRTLLTRGARRLAAQAKFRTDPYFASRCRHRAGTSRTAYRQRTA